MTSILRSFTVAQFLLLIICLSNISVSAFRVASRSRIATAINAAKQSSSDKIRVKLLADVKGTGRKGEVLFISPAMWTNVMAPKRLAQKMSDEEVANSAAQQAAVIAEDLLKARVLQDKITNMPRFVITRKVGVGKNLFGSVSHKQLVEMLKERFPENVTGPTSAIITEIKVCDVESDNPDATCPLEYEGEIRQTGVYKAIVKLHAKVDASFVFDVIAEAK